MWRKQVILSIAIDASWQIGPVDFDSVHYQGNQVFERHIRALPISIARDLYFSPFVLRFPNVETLEVILSSDV
jgi:hypothetical protein